MSRTKKNLVIFCLAALIVGWIGVGVDQLMPDAAEGEDTLGMAVWLVSPLVVVLILRGFGGDGWKDGGFHPRFKHNVKWYLIAFFTFPLVTFFTLITGNLAGAVLFEDKDWGMFISIFFGLFWVNVLKNFFEESVWRGYLSAKLAKFKFSDFKIYLVVGLIWGFWHAPYYLVFLPDEVISTVLDVNRVTFTLIAVVSMLAWSVLFVEIFFITGSVWSVVVLHAVEDALVNPLVIDGYISFSSNAEWIFSPIVGIIPTLGYLGVGLWLRNKRKGLGGRYSRLVPSTDLRTN